MTWSNWTGDQHCSPRAVEEPAGEADLALAVRRAADAGLRVRVAGSGHSFSDIACTDGVMVSLRRMRRVLGVDAERGLARVEGGITLRELGPQLAAHGLALENQGDIDAQTLAGAVCTATHGTGIRYGNLSTQVAGLRLVSGHGEVAEVGEEDRELLRAARVSLGSLGAISSLTLRCVPAFTLHRVDERVALDPVLDALRERVRASDHFELFVFPYTRSALTRTSQRTDREAEPPSPRAVWLRDVMLENAVLGLAGRAGRRWPGLVPRLNRGLVSLARRTERVDASHRIYASRREVRFTEMEYAIPAGEAAGAVREVLDLVERRRLPVGFPIEVRFTAADDALLSPAHGRESCYVAVHSFRGVEHEPYFRGVEAIMDARGGRPHWGKRTYASAQTLAPRYPEWERFQSLRRRLDPAGVFANEFTDRVLGRIG